MLVANHLSVRYGTHTVLDDVSVTIGRGEIVLFLGSSGVGKSTLLRVLSGLEPCTTGSLALDMQTIDRTTIHEKQLVGMVFQQFNLFEHLTVLENITLALVQVKRYTAHEASQKARQLLHRFDLLHKSDIFPARLSGGQKQRVALARALALNAPIICLDEPTSALDPQLSKYIGQVLHELAEQQLMIAVASHDSQLLEIINCTIHLMHEGKIVESARSNALKKSKEDFPRIAQFVYGKSHS